MSVCVGGGWLQSRSLKDSRSGNSKHNYFYSSNDETI